MRRIFLLGLVMLGVATTASAQDWIDDAAGVPCRFTRTGTVISLENDCVTESSIELSDGDTLDGSGHTIWAIDPPGGSFRGGVVVARGGTVSVVNTRISARQLASVCHGGDERLRGILFDNASGVIRRNTVVGLSQSASACEEGNAIEVRSRARDGRSVTVNVEQNLIDQYQKSGLVVQGAVNALVIGNVVGTSASQSFLAANALQIGPGATVNVQRNVIFGNSFREDDLAGTAILLVNSGPGTTVTANTIRGNADVGIHVVANDVVVTGNDLSDSGADGAYDVGIFNAGLGNVVSDNRVRGFRIPYSGVQEPSAGRQAVE